MLDLEAILNPTSPTAANETPGINDSDCSDMTNDHTTSLPTNSESSGLEELKDCPEVEETSVLEPELEAVPETEPREENQENKETPETPNEEMREVTLYTSDEEKREVTLYTTDEEKREVTFYTPDEEESLKTTEAEEGEEGIEEVAESGGDNFIPPFNNPLYPNNSYSGFGTGSVIGE